MLIDYHGIEFDFADADGELLDVRLSSRAEFLEHHGERWSGNDLPEPSRAAILAYAEAHLARDAYEHAGLRPTWTEAERRGCSNLTGRP